MTVDIFQSLTVCTSAQPDIASAFATQRYEYWDKTESIRRLSFIRTDLHSHTNIVIDIA